MTTEIKLDTAAMNALFPEGSTARVNLQQAVIQNFAERFVKGTLSDESLEQVKEIIRESVSPVVQETFATYFNTNRQAWPVTMTLNEKIKFSVQREIESQLDKMRHQLVNESLEGFKEKSLKNLQDSIAAMETKILASIESQVTIQTNEQVVKGVKAKLAEVFK